MGQGGRQPPLSPEVLGKNLREGVENGTLAFTAKADLEVVVEQYRIGFIKAIEDWQGKNPLFYDQPWDDEQGRTLLEALRYAAQHCNIQECIWIWMENNKFSREMKETLRAAA